MSPATTTSTGPAAHTLLTIPKFKRHASAPNALATRMSMIDSGRPVLSMADSDQEDEEAKKAMLIEKTLSRIRRDSSSRSTSSSTGSSSSDASNHRRRMSKRTKTTPKSDDQSPVLKIVDDGDDEVTEVESMKRQHGKRRKKSRKIFDPTDYVGSKVCSQPPSTSIHEESGVSGTGQQSQSKGHKLQTTSNLAETRQSASVAKLNGSVKTESGIPIDEAMALLNGFGSDSVKLDPVTCAKGHVKSGAIENGCNDVPASNMAPVVSAGDAICQLFPNTQFDAKPSQMDEITSSSSSSSSDTALICLPTSVQADSLAAIPPAPILMTFNSLSQPTVAAHPAFVAPPSTDGSDLLPPGISCIKRTIPMGPPPVGPAASLVETLCWRCKQPGIVFRTSHPDGGVSFASKPDDQRQTMYKSALLVCSVCSYQGHPQCLNINIDCFSRLVRTSSSKRTGLDKVAPIAPEIDTWRCLYCKNCAVCSTPVNSSCKESLPVDKGGNKKAKKTNRKSADPTEIQKTDQTTAGAVTICLACDRSAHADCTLHAGSKKRLKTCHGCRLNCQDQSGQVMAVDVISTDLKSVHSIPRWPLADNSRIGFATAEGLPPNWQMYPEDPSIPESINEWPAAQVKAFLIDQCAVDEVHANRFVSEGIDGNAVMLLRRSDVLQSLGLPLGIALKLHRHIQRLQTRRNFDSVL